MDVPQVPGWHRRLFDSDEGPSSVQKPHIVLLFKNLNRHMQKTVIIVLMQHANITFIIYKKP